MATLPTNRTVDSGRQIHADDHNELHRLHDLLDGSTAPSGGMLGVAGSDGTHVYVDIISPWGVLGDDDDGVPYYDPGAVTSGEEAILLPDLTFLRIGDIA